MNTLTIPFSGATANQADQVVIDMEDLVTIEQTNDTSTIIYVSNASSGNITLTHTAASEGAVANAINNTVLNSNSGNSIVKLPSGVSVSAVAYN
jgi:hypothetical protein